MIQYTTNPLHLVMYCKCCILCISLKVSTFSDHLYPVIVRLTSDDFSLNDNTPVSYTHLTPADDP